MDGVPHGLELSGGEPGSGFDPRGEGGVLGEGVTVEEGLYDVGL